MGKYRKKPVVVDAIQWTGENIMDVMEFMNPERPVHVGHFSNADDLVGIQTLEGLMVANKGDWILKGTSDEFYPVKEDIFPSIYEPVDEPGDWKGRVIREKQELDANRSKLEAFFVSETFKGLPEAERYRLYHQSSAMNDYSRALGERIEAFGD